MRDIQMPGRSPVMSAEAMIATSHPMSTAVGLGVLADGGNAMDAAVAACAVQCVTEPQSTGIGGDCFVLYHEAKSGSLHGLNGSGRAPAGATLEAYRRQGYSKVPETGIHSVTVPGAVHAWQTALERFGTKGLDELLGPAIRYAEEGCAVSPIVARAWRLGRDKLAGFEHTRRDFLADGAPLPAGTVHRKPALAKTLRAIAAGGAQAFYRAAIAEAIVAFSEASGGFFTLDDFHAHESTWVDPISSEYRGRRVCELPPNGQGLAALLMLDVLSRAEVGALERLGPDHVHLFAEAYKLALAERDRFVADPSFNELPIEGLLSAAFADSQWARIDMARALPEPVRSGYPIGQDTVYLTAVDRDRNIVSFINSICHRWGSGVVAGETGILLHNRAVNFSLEEGHLNCIEPGKRPLHTIIPAMVYEGGSPAIAFGVMGGHYQPMGHAYVLSNWLDFSLDVQEGIDAPRFQPEGGLLGVERGIGAQTRAGLAARGHEITEVDEPFGGAQAIFIDWKEGVLSAGSEPRKDGCALGF